MTSPSLGTDQRPSCLLSHRLRGISPEDVAPVVRVWLSEMRVSASSAGVPDDLFIANHRRLVLALLRRSWVTCACHPDNPDTVFGFVVFELAPARLHWLHVEDGYRRLGLGSSLLQSAFGEALGRQRILCSHWARVARLQPSFIARHRLVHSPYLLMRDTPLEEGPGSSERPVTFDGPDHPGP